MGKGQYEATKGMSMEDIYQTRFLPDLMDKIGDPDIYQDIYDRVFKKGRFIEGFVGPGTTNTYMSDFMDIDRNKMSNLDLLFDEWYNNSDAFDKSLDLLIRIAEENDKEALKAKEDYLKKHPYHKSHIEEKEEEEAKKKNKEVVESVGEAAYTQTGYDQVASNMAANNIPEQNIYNSTIQKTDDDERGRVEFTSKFFEENRNNMPQENAATFHQILPDGRVVMPDGTIYVDPNVLMQNRQTYPQMPMNQQIMDNVNTYVPIQYGGIPYQPEYFNIESDIVEPTYEPIQEVNQVKPEVKAPEFIIDNRIIASKDNGEKIPWCEYLMDSAAAYKVRNSFNNDEVFIPASKTATGLIKRKDIIREIYRRTGMTSGLFSFKYINSKTQFGIWMCTCNNTWLTIDYMNGAYSFTEEVPARQ